jgi:putative hydrolase of the HAD superfamily
MSERKEPAQLIVFDLGQVLVRVCDGWEDACRRVGIAPDRVQLSHRESAQMSEIVHRWDSGLIDLDQFAREVAPLRGLSALDVVRIHQAYLLGPFPGAVELVDELNDAGFQTACLSNTNAGHWKLMQTPGDPNFFPLDRLTFRFASHLVGTCKPDEKLFRHLEAHTQASGSKIIFFDDRSENVDAAKRIGWQAYRIEIDGDPVKQVRQHLNR